MPEKLLIVEDEPIVALDLREEIQEFGFEVTGLAESADAALYSIEERRPDMVLMDISIDGIMDGIQAARVLRDVYEVPVVFLTAYSDPETISRAARETPYGYLTKPFKARDLQATLQTALYKAGVDARIRESNRVMSRTLHGALEALIMLLPSGEIEFMNRSAERLTGLDFESTRGKLIDEAVELVDLYKVPFKLPALSETETSTEQFGWMLRAPGKDFTIVDFALRPLLAETKEEGRFVLSMRDALERIRSNEVFLPEEDPFDSMQLGMLQLDSAGRVVRVNQTLLQKAKLPMESLVGRTLLDLLSDPHPKISRHFMHMLLQPVRTPKQQV